MLRWPLLSPLHCLLHVNSFLPFGRRFGVLFRLCTGLHCTNRHAFHVTEVPARRALSLTQICVCMQEICSSGKKSQMHKCSKCTNFSQEGWLTFPEDIPGVEALFKIMLLSFAFVHSAALSSSFFLPTVEATELPTGR